MESGYVEFNKWSVDQNLGWANKNKTIERTTERTTEQTHDQSSSAKSFNKGKDKGKEKIKVLRVYKYDSETKKDNK
ncbi:MAG: hypothetical protein HQK49_14110 [Oligoflexia bacterium]|nr:hypothetical protein [Oligoflexia bacterium]